MSTEKGAPTTPFVDRSWKAFLTKLPEEQFAVYWKFRVTPPEGDPFDVESLPIEMKLSIDGKEIPQESWGQPVGFVVRDSMGKVRTALHCDPSKRADEPDEDLVSVEAAMTLAYTACRLLNETGAEFSALQAEKKQAEDRLAEVIAGVEKFYGDTDHVPVGLANLWREPDEW